MNRPFQSHVPSIADSAWVADSAEIIGRVTLAEDVNVWPKSVLRADVVGIRVGARTNLQDFTMIHGNHGDPDVVLGEDVTVGHRATLHGCRVGNRVLIGMGSIVLDAAVIEDDVMLGAGSLVPPGARLVSGGLYLGSPARRRRDLRPEELEAIRTSAYHYVQLAQLHAESETES